MKDLVEYRDVSIDGVKGWTWPMADQGAWIGPMSDWASIKAAIMRHVPERGLVVQAGGCCGMYPRILATNVFKHVITFEPDALNYYCLRENLKGFTNVIAKNAALGNSKAVNLYRRHDDNVGMHVTEPSATGSIPCVRIDDMGLERLDLLMLDMEGHEPWALLGGLETIRRLKPVIISERHDEPIKFFMEKQGYHEVEALPSTDRVYVYRKGFMPG